MTGCEPSRLLSFPPTNIDADCRPQSGPTPVPLRHCDEQAAQQPLPDVPAVGVRNGFFLWPRGCRTWRWAAAGAGIAAGRWAAPEGDKPGPAPSRAATPLLALSARPANGAGISALQLALRLPVGGAATSRGRRAQPFSQGEAGARPRRVLACERHPAAPWSSAPMLAVPGGREGGTGPPRVPLDVPLPLGGDSAEAGPATAGVARAAVADRQPPAAGAAAAASDSSPPGGGLGQQQQLLRGGLGQQRQSWCGGQRQLPPAAAASVGSSRRATGWPTRRGHCSRAAGSPAVNHCGHS